MAPQMGLIGFYIAQGYKIAYMALLGPFWPVGILLKRYNEVILGIVRNQKLSTTTAGGPQGSPGRLLWLLGGGSQGPLAFPWVPLALPGCPWPPNKKTEKQFFLFP